MELGYSKEQDIKRKMERTIRVSFSIGDASDELSDHNVQGSPIHTFCMKGIDA